MVRLFSSIAGAWYGLLRRSSGERCGCDPNLGEALFGGILIFSVLHRLTKFCAARRGAAMV